MSGTDRNAPSAHQQPRKRYRTPTLHEYGEIQKITQDSPTAHGTKDNENDKGKTNL